MLCCDVTSAAVLPAGLHHLPHPPQTHLSHPLATPGTHGQELRPQGRTSGADLRSSPHRLRGQESDQEQDPQQEAKPEFAEEPEGGAPDPDGCSGQTRKEKVGSFFFFLLQ